MNWGFQIAITDLSFVRRFRVWLVKMNQMAAVNSDTIALVCPGQPLVFEWRQLEATKLATEVRGKIQEIQEICFFLLPNVNLPFQTGAALHFNVPGSEEWTFLGHLDNEKKSAIIRTGWEYLDEHVMSINLGISLEPQDVVRNIEQTSKANQESKRFGFAMKLAQDLNNFVMSFVKNVPGQGEVIVLPTDAMQKWMARFESKYKRNPDFIFN